MELKWDKTGTFSEASELERGQFKCRSPRFPSVFRGGFLSSSSCSPFSYSSPQHIVPCRRLTGEPAKLGLFLTCFELLSAFFC